jgi:hypothetical protein
MHHFPVTESGMVDQKVSHDGVPFSPVNCEHVIIVRMSSKKKFMMTRPGFHRGRDNGRREIERRLCNVQMAVVWMDRMAQRGGDRWLSRRQSLEDIMDHGLLPSLLFYLR